ncbi:MAG: hypothetical protein HRT47_07345 [Candidatus Caenarcaniphilales bacterium]|nr:hypothetical protein [Candidatus Caenarcaniphilales bacterium]
MEISGQGHIFQNSQAKVTQVTNLSALGETVKKDSATINYPDAAKNIVKAFNKAKELGIVSDNGEVNLDKLKKYFKDEGFAIHGTSIDSVYRAISSEGELPESTNLDVYVYLNESDIDVLGKEGQAKVSKTIQTQNAGEWSMDTMVDQLTDYAAGSQYRAYRESGVTKVDISGLIALNQLSEKLTEDNSEKTPGIIKAKSLNGKSYNLSDYEILTRTASKRVKDQYEQGILYIFSRELKSDLEKEARETGELAIAPDYDDMGTAARIKKRGLDTKYLAVAIPLGKYDQECLEQIQADLDSGNYNSKELPVISNPNHTLNKQMVELELKLGQKEENLKQKLNQSFQQKLDGLENINEQRFQAKVINYNPSTNKVTFKISPLEKDLEVFKGSEAEVTVEDFSKKWLLGSNQEVSLMKDEGEWFITDY